MDRRSILKLGSAMPLLPMTYASFATAGETRRPPTSRTLVDFASDGRMLSPIEYSALLQERLEASSEVRDGYGAGGAVGQLEQTIATLTGKEAAVFMPSGTMANQLAIKFLSGKNSKVFVQEQSHVFRDEADAAQRIHGKRLMPLAPGKASFSLQDLTQAIADYRRKEVFETGVGAISIENTVRRQDEAIVDLEDIRAISSYARQHGIGMHLDGARVHMASAWSNISIREYASNFDTVYLSLYKYLGSPAGAVLAGDRGTMEQVRRWMKPLGAVMFQNWHNALIALHYLEGIEDRLEQVKTRSEKLFPLINQIDGLSVKTRKNGSNTSRLRLDHHDPRDFATQLMRNHGIRIAPVAGPQGIPLKVNETLLDVSNDTIVSAFRAALAGK